MRERLGSWQLSEVGGMARVGRVIEPVKFRFARGDELAKYREELHRALARYENWNVNVIPLRYGEKAPPLVKWEQYQKEPFPVSELFEWLNRGQTFNVAIVCGEVSRLYVIDFDTVDLYNKFVENLRTLEVEVYREITSKCPVAETGRGMHFYVRPSSGKIPRIKRLEDAGVDIKGEGGYVVAPPSLHPNGKRYNWVYAPPRLEPLSEKAEAALLQTLAKTVGKPLFEEVKAEPLKAEVPIEIVEIGPEAEAPEAKVVEARAVEVERGKDLSGLRELSESEVEAVVKLLLKVYAPGERHDICLSLSGWGAKEAMVHPLSIARVIHRLMLESGDEDDPRTRAATIVYSYARAGYRVDKSAIAAVFGVQPYGPEAEVERPLKGKAALREVFIRKLGREEGLRAFTELERVLEAKKGGEGEVIVLKWTDEGEPITWLRVDSSKNPIEVYLHRARGKKGEFELFARLPQLVAVRETATGNRFYLARNKRGEVTALATSLEELLSQLAALPAERPEEKYVAPTALRDTRIQRLFESEKVLFVEEGELAPGFGWDGFMDPLGYGFDASDYGVEGLLAVKEWVKKYYPSSNVAAALANIAFAVAKLVAPAVRGKNPTFTDMVVWNYGRGGEGKSTLLAYAVLPLLSYNPNEGRLLMFMRGAVETSAQMAFLISVNRMPLILDEQTLRALERNADIILSAVVGLGTFKIHAPRYGLLGEVKFRNLRGLIIATNIEFQRWLARVKHYATDIAFARRVLQISWENAAVSEKAFKDLPKVKPVLGAVQRVWLKHREEFVKTGDLIELTTLLFQKLAEEYRVDLGDYIEAVRAVAEQWEELRRSVKATDADILRERAYEIARQELGTTNLSGARVLESMLSNPHAYGISLSKPKKNVREEVEKVERIAQELAVRVETKNLSELLSVLAAKEQVLIVIRASSRLIPGLPKEFLGAPKGGYSFSGEKAHGYAIPLSKLIELFLGSPEEREEVSAENETNEKEEK